MRILICGDSPSISTGFSRCTRAVCDGLLAAGHTPIVLGISEFGGPHDFPYDIYPAISPLDKCHDAFGVARMPLLIDKLQPDAVVIENDGWNVKAYVDVCDSYFKDAPHLVPPFVGFLACDSLNQYAAPLNRLAHVAVWTRFAGIQFAKGGYEGEWTVVPLGVDSHFKPLDKAESRRKIGIDEDAYVVGFVGRLQTRKRIDALLEYFAKWVCEYELPPKVQLLIHAAPTGDIGCNVRAVAQHYGLIGERRLLLSEPNIGKGVEDELLPALYSALDCFLVTSQAEGFCLPVLEAMACGTPCTVPDFAAFGGDGWVDDAAVRVPCTSHALTAPMNAQPYTIGAIPDREATVLALNRLYASPHTRQVYRERGLVKAAEFTWQRTGTMMVELLERVVDEHRNRRKEGVNDATIANEAEVVVDSATAAE